MAKPYSAKELSKLLGEDYIFPESKPFKNSGLYDPEDD